MLKKTFLAICLILVTFGWSSPVEAQLARDVRDIFKSLMDDLDKDLKAKFKEAIKKDSNTVEFTPDQFFRFRDNPANPFQGLDNISPDKDGGNIAISFELPSIRNRTVNSLERQSPIVLSQIQEPIHSAAVSTVAIKSDGEQVALGIVVKSDGFILTKASQIESLDSLVCEFQNGQLLDAKLVRTDTANDLAIVKVETKGLPTINWSDEKPQLGAFVLTPKPSGAVLALGTYSVAPRSTVSGEQAFLGVKPEGTAQGVQIWDVRPGNASFEAGLQDGDVITKLGGVVMTDVPSLVDAIKARRPGDQVAIEYLRKGQAGKTTATLASHSVSGKQAARYKMMNRLGAVPSNRHENFPRVFQHDSPMFPEHCGGPITDLDGNVIGINIARVGRAATYAIPSGHVQKLLSDLLRSNVASRK